MQDVDAQKQCNTNNTAEPGIDANPTVTCNNKHSNKSFLSVQIRQDDMKPNVEQPHKRNYDKKMKASFQSKLEKMTQWQM